MNPQTKKTITRYSVILIIAIVIICNVHFLYLIPSTSARAEIRIIDSKFKNATFDLPDDYEISWTCELDCCNTKYHNILNYKYHQFYDTQWYYCNAVVYPKNNPVDDTDVVLWVDIETGNCHMIGDIK